MDVLFVLGFWVLWYGYEFFFVILVIVNDFFLIVVELIWKNVKYNGLEDIIRVFEGDVLGVMYRVIVDDLSKWDSRGNLFKDNKFDVIDFDFYGMVVFFFDVVV